MASEVPASRQISFNSSSGFNRFNGGHELTLSKTGFTHNDYLHR
ncbi:hypothetical protein HMPREF1613_03589 [Escherichia coli 908616]|nr:hypothetical protein HMPREF1613_03589 [Escherichia coli 908616]